MIDTNDGPQINNFSFSKPAVYLIKVQGKIRENCSNRLGGMQITTSSQKDNRFISTLTGSMKDQSALSGLLNTLFEMSLLVLSVEILNNIKE